MHKLTAVSTLVLAAFLITGCQETKVNDPSPSTLTTAPTSFEAAGVSADVTAAAPVIDRNNRVCRAFTIPLEVTVRAGELDVSLTDISVRFVNSSGTTAPQVTLPAPLPIASDVQTTPPAPVPTVQFGSDLIAARSIRAIPLVVHLGCTDPAGTVIVILDTRDGRGRRRSVEVRTPVPRGRP